MEKVWECGLMSSREDKQQGLKNISEDEYVVPTVSIRELLVDVQTRL